VALVAVLLAAIFVWLQRYFEDPVLPFLIPIYQTSDPHPQLMVGRSRRISSMQPNL
jgi:hypothetical protein